MSPAWVLVVGWAKRGEGRCLLTFFTFLFHSSFATCTLTVFRASPAETTIPLISLDKTPEDVFVTVFAAAATAGATALADIAVLRTASGGVGGVVGSRPRAAWLYPTEIFGRKRLQL